MSQANNSKPNARKSDPISQVVDFLASVKLSFSIFIILAVASVAGTIIPQNQPAQVYINGYGQTMGNLILGLGIDDTYRTGWYIFLLAMLAVNLVVCSLKRLPTAIKIMTKDPREELGRFPKPDQEAKVPGSLDQVKAQAAAALKGKVGEAISNQAGDSTTLFAQNGAWSRMGVYVVHISVLIIFIGAIISNIWGVNGTLVIHEGQTETSMELSNRQQYPLGFEVRLDDYSQTFYEKFKSIPSEFRSDLTILENGKEVTTAIIRMNEPFEYKGYVFYQSFRGQSPTELKARMIRRDKSQEIQLAFRKWRPLPGGGRAGVMEFREEVNMGKTYKGPFARILLEDKQGRQHQMTAFAPGFKVPSNMMPDHVDVRFEIISANTSWYSGLQVKKDPGVWWVWIGCGLMVLGFFIAFYCSHRKVWIKLTPDGNSCRVEIAGSASKNRPAMRRITMGLARSIAASGQGEEK